MRSRSANQLANLPSSPTVTKGEFSASHTPDLTPSTETVESSHLPSLSAINSLMSKVKCRAKSILINSTSTTTNGNSNGNSNSNSTGYPNPSTKPLASHGRSHSVNDIKINGNQLKLVPTPIDDIGIGVKDLKPGSRAPIALSEEL